MKGKSSKVFWTSWQTFSKGKNTGCGVEAKVSNQIIARDL